MTFALLLSSCRKHDDNEAAVRAIIGMVSADSLRADVQWLQNMGTRFTLSPMRRRVAVKIRNRFIGMGYADARLDSFALTVSYKGTLYTGYQYNVTARLEGSVNPDSVCIIGGHYDDIVASGDPFTSAPGAHDNASGTSAVLEIARVLKKAEFTPGKTILFIAFGAEELGLYGSKYFAGNAGEYTGKISFMLNYDMIGYMPASNAASWKVNIMDYDNSHQLRKDAQNAVMLYTDIGSFNDNTYNKYSDSYPFASQGYKAIFFYTGAADPYYHTAADVVTNLNFDYCSQVVKASCGLLVEKNQ